ALNDLVGARFNSITISGSGYTLGAAVSAATNAVTLASASSTTGALNVNTPGGSSDGIGFNIVLGGAAGGKQFFNVTSAGSTLTVTGTLSTPTANGQPVNVGLSKDGQGRLVLSADNGAYTGSVTVLHGILEITTATALGGGAGTT